MPRAEFAEYDAASPALRNRCTQDTRNAVLDTLRMWASDNTTPNVYWLNGRAGTGKTTIAYSFSEILDNNESLGGTFFSSHLRVDTSDVRCIIPTICLQLAVGKYHPSFSHLILDVVEDNPDCKSWSIAKQFLNFIVKPLTAAHRDTKKIVFPVIVLDALDECSDQSLVAELLSMILKYSMSLPVKFFITSRPEIRLKESFAKFWTHTNFIYHEVEKEIVKTDIEPYIKGWLHMHGSGCDNWPLQTVASPVEDDEVVLGPETPSSMASFTQKHPTAQKPSIFDKDQPVSKRFDWADDAMALPSILPTYPQHPSPPRNLRSTSGNPFSSLQRRRRGYPKTRRDSQCQCRFRYSHYYLPSRHHRDLPHPQSTIPMLERENTILIVAIFFTQYLVIIFLLLTT